MHAYRDQVERTSRLDYAAGRETDQHQRGDDLFEKSNYQNFQRYPEWIWILRRDAEATLPSLIEAVKQPAGCEPQSGVAGREARSWPTHHERRCKRVARRGGVRLGRQPDQYGAAVARRLWAQIKDEDWSLVSTSRIRQPLAAAAVGFRQTLPVHRRTRAGTASVTARPPRSAPRWRTGSTAGLSVNIQCDGDLMYAPGRFVDGGAPSHSAAERDAQQSRLSSGSDAGADHGEPAQPRRGSRENRHDDRRSGHRLLQSWRKVMGVYAEGPISDPKELGSRVAAGDRGGEARGAGVG